MTLIFRMRGVHSGQNYRRIADEHAWRSVRHGCDRPRTPPSPCLRKQAGLP